MSQDNVWARVFNHLKSKNIDVYSPGTHRGEAKKKYVVVKHGHSRQLPGFSTYVLNYDILLYIPQDNYSQVEDFVSLVHEIMLELRPMIMPIHRNTAPYHDEAIKAYMVSMTYTNNRFMKN